MDPEKIEPNSRKYREEKRQREEAEREKLKPVASGKVTKKNKASMKEVFFAEDMGSVKSYIFTDVIIPAAQNLIEDIVTNGIRYLVRGTAAPSRDRGSGRSSYIQYGKCSENSSRRTADPTQKQRFDFNSVIFEVRGDAELVLQKMDELMEDYDYVRVSDFYDLSEISAPPQAYRYGWTDIRSAEVVRDRDGFRIKLPKAMPID